VLDGDFWGGSCPRGGMSDTFAYVAMAVCPVVILFDIVSTDRQTDTADVILSTVMYCR